MHCGSCEALIKDALEETKGVRRAEAFQKDNKVMVEYDDAMIDEAKIKGIIKRQGYEVE